MDDRVCIVDTVLGPELKFRSADGTEGIGFLFTFYVVLLSLSNFIDPRQMLGTPLTLTIDHTTPANGPGKRFLTGHIAGFYDIGRDGDYHAFKAIVRPWLWLATLREDFRIFQFKTIVEITKELLTPFGFHIEYRLTGEYRIWEYCVQYGESTFDFLLRRWAKEGIYFYFKHEFNNLILVLGDGIGSHSPLPTGPEEVPFHSPEQATKVLDEDYIGQWGAAQDIVSGGYSTIDYDFTKPNAKMTAKEVSPAGHAHDKKIVFKWPGGYKEFKDGENYGKIRIEAIQAMKKTVRGAGNARNLAPGFLMKLIRHPVSEYNKKYLIIEVTYHFTENVRRSDGGGHDTPTTFTLEFLAVPGNIYYRIMEPLNPPRTFGPQTAVVVGPPGEEIYTNEYGQIKVQFRWDMYGLSDQDSSCWIRVSQSWAGSMYGTMHIPRIGQEVIVDFFNGDADLPIVTGEVYNAFQMPPWPLPANKTQSGIKTRSSLDGIPGSGLKNTPGTANVLRFEDKAGAEQVWIHAQKDQLAEVEHDEDKWVGNDRRKVIDRDEFNTVHRDRTEVVDRNEKINVHGWRTEEVDKDETVTIHQNRKERVDLNENISIGQNRTEDVGKNENISIGANRTESVGNNEKVKIGVNQNLTVGANKQETIGLTSLKNVGIAQMTNIGAAYSLNVGGLWQTNVGFANYETIGKIKKVTVGTATTLESGKSTTITAGEEIIITAGKSLIIQSGGAKIVLDGEKNTITIIANEVLVDGSSIVDVNSLKIDLN